MGRILVLDDNAPDRQALREALRSMGHEADVADNENLGFELLDGGDFELVLLDLELPQKGGSRVLVRLVQDYPTIKVLVTARGGETISTRDYLKIADDLRQVRALPKPFDLRRLARAVDVMLTGAEWRR